MTEYRHEVARCASGQWRYAVIEIEDGEAVEVEGGAGFESEDEADFAGFDAAATWRGRLETPDY
jgi:hypothetical protein